MLERICSALFNFLQPPINWYTSYWYYKFIFFHPLMLAQCFFLFCHFFELFPDAFVVQTSIQAFAKTKERNAAQYYIQVCEEINSTAYGLNYRSIPWLCQRLIRHQCQSRCVLHTCAHKRTHRHTNTELKIVDELAGFWHEKKYQCGVLNGADVRSECWMRRWNMQDVISWILIWRGLKKIKTIHIASQWGSISEKPSHSSCLNMFMDCITVSCDIV